MTHAITGQLCVRERFPGGMRIVLANNFRYQRRTGRWLYHTDDVLLVFEGTAEEVVERIHAAFKTAVIPANDMELMDEALTPINFSWVDEEWLTANPLSSDQEDFIELSALAYPLARAFWQRPDHAGFSSWGVCFRYWRRYELAARREAARHKQIAPVNCL